MNKKALSPVVASVLMILLVIVLASLIFLWARGFVSEQIEKFGQPIENLCGRVDFDVQKVRGVTSTDALEIVNRGDVDIFHLDIKMYKGGDSEINQFKFSVGAGESLKKDISLKMKDNSIPEKIDIFPALVGNVKGKHSNKVFTCNEVSKTIHL